MNQCETMPWQCISKLYPFSKIVASVDLLCFLCKGNSFQFTPILFSSSKMYASMPYKRSDIVVFLEGELIATKYAHDGHWYRARITKALEREYEVTQSFFVALLWCC